MKFLNQIGDYILRSYTSLIFKLLISFFLTIISMFLLFHFHDNSKILFSIIYFVNYMIVKIVYDLFINNTKTLYNQITNEFNIIQKNIENNDKLNNEVKGITLRKFNNFRDIFLRGAMSSKFLSTNIYNPELESDNFLSYINEITEVYHKQCRKGDKYKDFLIELSSIYDKSLSKFTKRIQQQIYGHERVVQRRYIFSNELGNMLKETTNALTKNSTNNKK